MNDEYWKPINTPIAFIQEPQNKYVDSQTTSAGTPVYEERSPAEIAYERQIQEQGLYDATPDILTLGLGGRAIDSAMRGASKAANMVSSRFYNPVTYRGLARNFSKNRMPIRVEPERGVFPEGLPRATKQGMVSDYLDDAIYGSFNPRHNIYLAKTGGAEAHELDHAGRMLKGQSYGASPDGNLKMLTNSAYNRARSYRMRPWEKNVDMAAKLYRGNEGERNARFAEWLYQRELNPNKMSKEMIAKARAAFDEGEIERGVHGFRNTLDPRGIANKRALIDKLNNPEVQKATRGLGLAAYLEAKTDPYDIDLNEIDPFNIEID